MFFEDKCGSRGERTAVCHPVPDAALWICWCSPSGNLPADHDQHVTPWRPLRHNLMGHKRSARHGWRPLSLIRSFWLPSPIRRPYHHKVDQPIAPVIVPLDASGHPSHPGAVGCLDRSQPLSGKGPDAVQPCPLLRPDRDASPITSLRLQAAIGQGSIPRGGAVIAVAVDPDQVARG